MKKLLILSIVAYSFALSAMDDNSDHTPLIKKEHKGSPAKGTLARWGRKLDRNLTALAVRPLNAFTQEQIEKRNNASESKK